MSGILTECTFIGKNAGANLMDCKRSALLGDGVGSEAFIVKNLIMTTDYMLCRECLYYFGAPRQQFDEACPRCGTHVVLK